MILNLIFSMLGLFRPEPEKEVVHIPDDFYSPPRPISFLESHSIWLRAQNMNLPYTTYLPTPRPAPGMMDVWIWWRNQAAFDLVEEAEEEVLPCWP